MARTSFLGTLRSRLSAAVRRLSAALAARTAVDTRALAAFRIGLGAILIADLLRRARSLTAFYTDAGVLPRRALFADYSGAYSLHALSGESWAVASLFAVAGVVALALLVGYRTRLATAVSWLLLLSLQARNPMVLNAGDALLAMLLFWGFFLPLGSRWSVDALRRADAAGGHGGGSASDHGAAAGDSASDADTGRRRGPAVATVASMGVLLQILVMYVTNAVHKLEGDLWLGGEAVAYVMQADHFTYHLGNHLGQFPALLRAATFVWVALLFASPLLVVLTGIPRAALASLFVGTHLGMAATMRIDLFPIISVVGFLPFFQTPVWDAAERGLDRFGPSETLDRWRARLESAGGEARVARSVAVALVPRRPRPPQRSRPPRRLPLFGDRTRPRRLRDGGARRLRRVDPPFERGVGRVRRGAGARRRRPRNRRDGPTLADVRAGTRPHDPLVRGARGPRKRERARRVTRRTGLAGSTAERRRDVPDRPLAEVPL
nr:HTTM domain-containing protein [Halorubrum sp. GN11_10-6_MGM]